MSRLEELVVAARADLEQRRATVPLDDLRAGLGERGGGRPFNEALVRPGLSLIAEFKRASPSAGEIASAAGVTGTVSAFERGGAAAISILTDRPHFRGSLDDLREARE